MAELKLTLVVACALIDADNRVLIAQRPPGKAMAGLWEFPGGKIEPGERPETALARELAEELGIATADLRPFGTSVFEDATTRCVEHVFETTWDGPVVHADGEVVWGAWMTLGGLAEHLADPGWPFVPDTRALLAGLAADGAGDYAGLLLGPAR
jgi:8-oxo-dGTP diphosphatase